jgi:hypothetical protein
MAGTVTVACSRSLRQEQRGRDVDSHHEPQLNKVNANRSIVFAFLSNKNRGRTSVIL